MKTAYRPMPGRAQFNGLMIFLLLFDLCSCRENETAPQPPDASGRFTNPLLESAPDPWVVQSGEWYYFTHTTGNSLRLYRTRQMSALKDAAAKTVWTVPAAGPNSKNIWAPELHFINDKWYFYYAADDGVNENHRMFVLENSSVDPFSGEWIDKGEVQLPDDAWAIDGTTFFHGGQLYFLWSGWEGNVNEQQNIYIAKMQNPWTAEGERVILSMPELSWELAGGPPYVNEAPQFLLGSEKLVVVYSASGCWTDDYSLGLLTAELGSDLLDRGSWDKHVTPVLSKNASSQAYGPGHNSFFKSPDGKEDWLIYHANDLSGAGCGNERSVRMQKFTWNNGIPDFGIPVALGALVPVPSGEN